MKSVKAVALLSGGLDSHLSAKIIKLQQIDVIGVTFISPFFGSKKAILAASELGIPLKIIDISASYLDLLKAPKYGFGKNLNPCLDCHILMVKKAGEYMQKIGADFLITGEVVGSRPKSQSRDSLKILEKVSGLNGLILRPLSAKTLSLTIPEDNGWVDRERLYEITGRSRKIQIELAKELGIEKYSQPAGGCLLTDENYSRRVRDLLQHAEPTINDIQLLKPGRHFRLSDQTKIIVGRNHIENSIMLELAQPYDIILQVQNYGSPIVILRGKDLSDEAILKAAQLCARYSDAKEMKRVEVIFNTINEKIGKSVIVSPYIDKSIERI